MKALRDTWHDTLAEVLPDKLVFVDESGARTNMTRLYGWGPVGERVVDPVPHGHWKTCTMLAAVRLSGPLAAVTIDAAVNAEAFVLWTREVLAPCLTPGDVVVMDNLPAHKHPDVARAVEAVGASVRYLPPYSPDFNPIENLWSKVKTHLRAAAARTYEALGEAIDQALASITREDCRGFFGNCGYLAL
ncbi:MAG: IS630 family transposase [Tepidisphaeraceae bacterium]